jgi:hypothetical protein
MATTVHSNAEIPHLIRGASRTKLAYTLFSFPVVCMFLMAGRLMMFCVQQFTESDLWWHLRNAHTLLHYHSFSPIDTYSFTAAGTPWISFEWLSEVAYFFAFTTLGLRGMLLLFFLLLVAIYSAVYYRSWRAGADCKDAAITTFGAICLGGVSIGPRTLLFGWLCMTALLLVLDRFHRSGKGLWLLPPLFALWINLHGSWPFGVVVLAVAIVSGLFDGQWGLVEAHRWRPGELRQLFFVFAASTAALFVNPFGYKLVLYPLDLLLHQQGVMNLIEEWTPVRFGTVNGTLALGVIFGLIAAALFSRRPWRLDDVLLTAFALWAGLSHVRFMFFAGLIIMPILAPRLHVFPPYERERDKPRLNFTIMMALSAAMAYYFPSEVKLQQKVDEEFPQSALAFMKQHQVSGRIFNQYKFGGYMELNSPEFKTFIDGRADLFTHTGVFYDYLKATGLQDSLEILDKYDVRYVLLQPGEPMVYMLQHSADWNTLYCDKVAVLLGRGKRSADIAANVPHK